MGQVLTTDSTVKCGHGDGKVSTSSQAKLTVNGAPVLVAASITNKTVANCGTTPSSSTAKCTTANAPMPGSLATKLTAGGAPVVLDSLTGTTIGTPPGALAATGAAQKLSAS